MIFWLMDSRNYITIVRMGCYQGLDCCPGSNHVQVVANHWQSVQLKCKLLSSHDLQWSECWSVCTPILQEDDHLRFLTVEFQHSVVIHQGVLDAPLGDCSSYTAMCLLHICCTDGHHVFEWSVVYGRSVQCENYWSQDWTLRRGLMLLIWYVLSESAPLVRSWTMRGLF